MNIGQPLRALQVEPLVNPAPEDDPAVGSSLLALPSVPDDRRRDVSRDPGRDPRHDLLGGPDDPGAASPAWV